MQWKGLNITVIIISLLAGMALFFGAQLLYQKYSFQRPLNTALHENKAVESFQVIDENRVKRIVVCIRYDANLMQAYSGLQKDLEKAMYKRPFILELNDNRDETLNEVWHESQYAVYQAISQGSFQDMAAVVESMSMSRGAEAYIYIDTVNVYIRLKHQGHTLDEVIPWYSGRANGNVQASATAGGAKNAQRN